MIDTHVDLFPYNTFHLHSRAHRFVRVSEAAQVPELVQQGVFDGKFLILGGGSNILLLDDFEGTVVYVDLQGKHKLGYHDDHCLLKVSAGENWHRLVMFCVQENLGGIENLSLIPGTVGAAPIQNIGAYGVEVKDVVEHVEAVSLSSGEIRTFDNAACAFGYRDSYFKNEGKDKYFITSVTFKLTSGPHQYHVEYGALNELLANQTLSLMTISDAVIKIRSSKLPDPAVLGNAGSFFKNPTITSAWHSELKQKYPTIPSFSAPEGMVKVPAAWLIEQCGWKGKRRGDVGVHAKQALVIVNYGGGSGKEIWQLACDIKKSVMDQFNIDLTPEVNVIQ